MNDFSIFKFNAAFGLVMASCVLFSTLPACGQKPSSAEAEQRAMPAADPIPATGIARAHRLMDEAQVVCADDHNCPENVGMVVATDAGVVRCTGALIGSDLLMTSNRCVPESVRSGAVCGDLIHFVLPALAAGNQPAQEAHCGKVLEAAPGRPYAFIRLDAPVTARRALSVNQGGLGDQDRFTIPVVNPTSDSKPFGEIRVVSSRAYQKTALLPQFRGPFSPVAALGGSRVTATNFGAPVLDEQGGVRAVLQGDFAPEAIQQIQQSYAPLLQNTPVADFAFAANLACMQVPGIGHHALPAECAQDVQFQAPEGALARAIPADVLASTQLEVTHRVSQWQATAGQKFHWGSARVAANPSQVIQPFPVCIAGSDQWLSSEYHHWYVRGGYSSDEQLTLQVPSYQVFFSVNAYLQTRADVQNLATTAVILHFNPKELAESGHSTVKWLSGASGAVIGGPAVLPKCN